MALASFWALCRCGFWCFGVVGLVFGGNLVFSSLAGLVGLVVVVVTIVVGGVVFRLLAGNFWCGFGWHRISVFRVP